MSIVDWDFVVAGGENNAPDESVGGDVLDTPPCPTQKPAAGFKLGQLITAQGKFQARLVQILNRCCSLTSLSQGRPRRV